MAFWSSVKKLFSVQQAIQLKQNQDWRDSAYRWWLLKREGWHALFSALFTLGIVLVLGGSVAARIAGPAAVLAAVAVIEWIHSYRGQQPWKGVVDLLVWASAAILVAAYF